MKRIAPPPTPPKNNLIRKKELLEKLQLSDATIWRMERDDKFPKRLRIGPNSVAWIEAEVDEWIDNKAAQRDMAGCCLGDGPANYQADRGVEINDSQGYNYGTSIEKSTCKADGPF